MTNLNNQNVPDTFVQKLKKVGQLLRLTNTESQAMRERLSAYADLHAVNAGAPAARRTPGTRSVRSPYFVFFTSRAFVASALILILILGSGASVTYAAGNSLPGQTLYPIKVDVDEPVQGAVIAATEGTEGTAEWQNTLAERRITEAATLAAEGKLASSTEQYLQNQAELHVAQSEDDSAQLAAAGNTNAADDVRTDLAARLAAHAQLLTLIDTRLAADGNATTTTQIATLLNSVNQDQGKVLFGRESGEGEAGITSSSSSQTNSTSADVTLGEATTSRDFRSREQGFFNRDKHILSLLPSTTTSTSPSSFKKHHSGEWYESSSVTASSTDPSDTTITATTTSDFPASSTPESTTSIQINL